MQMDLGSTKAMPAGATQESQHEPDEGPDVATTFQDMQA